MYVSKFQVLNYKSFRNSGEIPLKPGINVIVGRNNSGKSSIAEALSLQFFNKSHNSLVTRPRRKSVEHGVSTIRCEIVLTAKEVRELFSVTPQGLDFGSDRHGRSPVFDEAQRALSKGARIDYEYSVLPNNNSQRRASFRDAEHPHEAVVRAKYDANTNRLEKVDNTGEDYRAFLARNLVQQFYYFEAERLKIHSSSIGTAVHLASNASNLAEVLHNLQNSNPARFRRYTSLVNEILPDIRAVTIPFVGGSVQIMLWPLDPLTERDDLAVPLSESGTGVSQILAMLYVLVMSEISTIVIIDEPNSFLHPGAVRALLGIFARYPEHQYIITTNSPQTVSAADPEQVLLVKKDTSESRVEVLDSRRANELQGLLDEIGARISDVFGAESILWVEGRTEELCFPLILRKIARQPLTGTSILGVVRTGDLQGKHRELILQLYSQLSQGGALLPRAIAFIVDSEELTTRDIEDLQRRPGAGEPRIHVLPRRMYENYLLIPEAITAVLQEEDPANDMITGQLIRTRLESGLSEKKYHPKNAAVVSAMDLLHSVDAAKLLSDIFSEVTDHRVAFVKTRHSLAITKWLISNKPEVLRELSDLLVTIISSREHASGYETAN